MIPELIKVQPNVAELVNEMDVADRGQIALSIQTLIEQERNELKSEIIDSIIENTVFEAEEARHDYIMDIMEDI